MHLHQHFSSDDFKMCSFCFESIEPLYIIIYSHHHQTRAWAQTKRPSVNDYSLVTIAGTKHHITSLSKMNQQVFLSQHDPLAVTQCLVILSIFNAHCKLCWECYITVKTVEIEEHGSRVWCVRYRPAGINSEDFEMQPKPETSVMWCGEMRAD